MMNAESLISDKVIWIGMVSPEAAAKGRGEVNDGFVERYVFKGFAWYLSVSKFGWRARKTNLNSRFQGEEGVPGIAHLEDASKAVDIKISNL